MAGNFIDFKSTNLIELLGPVDRTTGLPVAASSTATALLFDASKDTYAAEKTWALSADEAAGETVLSVADIDGLAGSDLVRVDMDDGSSLETSVVTAAAGPPATITVADVLTFGGASKGNLIRRHQTSTINQEIFVKNTAGWRVGDRCSLSLDLTGTSFHVDRVRQVFDGFIKLDSAPATPCSVGNSVACSIETGTPITLSSFGTPFPTAVEDTVEGDPAWGFRGDLPSTSFDIDTLEAGNLGLKLGQKVRIEYTLTLAGGAVMFRKTIATVVNL
jgi:hypothetical protein